MIIICLGNLLSSCCFVNNLKLWKLKFGVIMYLMRENVFLFVIEELKIVFFGIKN